MFPTTAVIVDMFPHTDDIHAGVSGQVECVTLLQKINRKLRPDSYVKLSLDVEMQKCINKE